MRYAKVFVVRWADCDANGHMRNTAYSEYAIETRLSYFAERGFPVARFAQLGIGPVLRREEIDFKRELHIGETVEVDMTCVGVSPDGARFKIGHEFWRPGAKQSARLVVSGGWMDLRARKLVLPPPELKAAMFAAPMAEPLEELPPLKTG
ncbi:MAG: thioesterase family protein [Anaeromyxobacter sp.]